MNHVEYGPTQITLTVAVSVIIYLYYSATAARLFAKAGLPATTSRHPRISASPRKLDSQSSQAASDEYFAVRLKMSCARTR